MDVSISTISPLFLRSVITDIYSSYILFTALWITLTSNELHSLPLPKMDSTIPTI